jgi:hypothetical protein
MFKELAPLVRHRAVLFTVTRTHMVSSSCVSGS